MPIYHDTGRVQLEFGYGDILVSHGVVEDKAAVVCFFRAEPTPIGTKITYEEPLEVAAEDTPVRMVFNKLNSVDVLINALLDAKRMIIHAQSESVTPLEEKE